MKVLIANRGEIAVRIIRACHELGWSAVAIYTDADQSALHVQLADEAYHIGTNQKYLDIAAIMKAVRHSKAKIVHPGYGFLSENADLAQAVEEAGLIFAGPRPRTIEMTGSKLAARKIAQQDNVPVLFGTDEPLPSEIPTELARQIPYPILVKAAAGGGGRGIRLANSYDDLCQMAEEARREALAAFGNDDIYLEALVNPARHIEVQILGDGEGRILCLGERECSIQRRRQKIIEEAPAPNLSENIRSRIHEAAVRLGQTLKYRSLGTVEFLLDQQGDFHFIEINPRIQVEHPVTEMVTGIDLVKEQLLLAAGEGLRYKMDTVEMRGAAIDARVLAEDTENGFMPATGVLSILKEPGGPGIRVDSALFLGQEISAQYDSLLAKVIAWGEDRPAAIQRLRQALQEFQIAGVLTDLDFLLNILESPRYKKGDINTTFLDTFQLAEPKSEPQLERDIALAAALFAQHKQKQIRPDTQSAATDWQTVAWREQMRGTGQ